MGMHITIYGLVFFVSSVALLWLLRVMGAWINRLGEWGQRFVLAGVITVLLLVWQLWRVYALDDIWVQTAVVGLLFCLVGHVLCTHFYETRELGCRIHALEEQIRQLKAKLNEDKK